MYNPTTLKFAHAVSLKECGQTTQADRVDFEDVVVQLFFDTFEAQTDVRNKTDRIVKLTKFTEGPGHRKMPPLVHLVWGSPLFTGIVTKVDVTYTMFLPDGRPVRATVEVIFKAEPTELERDRNQGLPNCRQLWTVAEGDRLYLIAQQAYGDSTLWPMIAQANNIRDVLAFPAPALIGQVLAIPDIHNETFEPKPGETYE
ncbi:peptidoglycan-binding protein LysM [Trinickia dinghuensis]|uniref:Peptidoglycan-binding protein LysM n=2 Tax=Trinickia dinghuensis TaxID=2291023 RepID=A0A3D8JXV9_9BURK|nr:peptidoglycan-binding protein LysM [Trinickia dinghuensis]